MKAQAPENAPYDLPVEDFLARWPAAVAVFLRHRMACVGCALAKFDTVAEAADTYGVARESFFAELRACSETL